MTTIAVQTWGKHGFRTEHVSARYVTSSGRLAVHPTLPDDEFGCVWDITHVPTGWRVFLAGRTPYETMCALADKLDALDWDFAEVCKLPADTVAGAVTLIRGIGVSTIGPSDYWKEQCFAEPQP